jgi:hypothetical protein
MDEQTAARAHKATAGITPEVTRYKSDGSKRCRGIKLPDPKTFAILTVDSGGHDLEFLQSKNFNVRRVIRVEFCEYNHLVNSSEIFKQKRV